MKKILIFTDSRDQHISQGYSYNIFLNRIKNELKDVEVDLAR